MFRPYCFLLILLYAINCAGSEQLLSLQSGSYGNFLGIVNTHGQIYGQFQYYEKWNEEVNFFENVCTFYFYGEFKGNDTIFLKVGLPGFETTGGKIVVHENDSITLYTDFSSGYMFVDFTTEGYTAKLNTIESDAIALGIVKAEKCYFHSSPTPAAITKGYIVERDFVSILQQTDQWLQVKYISPVSDREFIKWIKSSALYDKDPENW